MKVGKEFKYWGMENQSSQGYYAEADLSEFPTLQEMAQESLEKNELVYAFLSYVAIRRCYSTALKEGFISQQQYDTLLRPFKDEMKFEKQIREVESLEKARA